MTLSQLSSRGKSHNWLINNSKKFFLIFFLEFLKSEDVSLRPNCEFYFWLRRGTWLEKNVNINSMWLIVHGNQNVGFNVVAREDKEMVRIAEMLANFLLHQLM